MASCVFIEPLRFIIGLIVGLINTRLYGVLERRPDRWYHFGEVSELHVYICTIPCMYTRYMYYQIFPRGVLVHVCCAIVVFT